MPRTQACLPLTYKKTRDCPSASDSEAWSDAGVQEDESCRQSLMFIYIFWSGFCYNPLGLFPKETIILDNFYKGGKIFVENQKF